MELWPVFAPVLNSITWLIVGALATRVYLNRQDYTE